MKTAKFKARRAFIRGLKRQGASYDQIGVLLHLRNQQPQNWGWGKPYQGGA